MALTQLLDVAAPAKLNLFLHVVGRRPDGYHLLQSVFMLIDWCDTLHFECRSDGQIRRRDLSAPTLPADDLVVRAARLLQQASATPLGADIALDKRIPLQAGLGGGSSDAASTLWALNQLWGLHWPTQRLQTLGAQLGADVPFFLGGQHAWVEGIGEILTPLALPASTFLVLKPPRGVSTPDIFGHPDLKRDEKSYRIEDFLAHSSSGEGCASFGWGSNGLQAVAQRLCPDIGVGLEWLQAQGWEGRMTGSGSAVFAHLPTGANTALPATLPEGWTARICKNLDAHPLFRQNSG